MFTEDDFKAFSPADIYEAALPDESEYDISARLEWRDMGSEWKDTLAERGNSWWIRESDELPSDARMMPLMELKDILLDYGGESVCFPYIEEDLGRIIERGILWDGADAEMMLGQPSQCHMNSAYCWDANRDKTTIATGYALSEDSSRFFFLFDDLDLYVLHFLLVLICQRIIDGGILCPTFHETAYGISGIRVTRYSYFPHDSHTQSPGFEFSHVVPERIRRRDIEISDIRDVEYDSLDIAFRFETGFHLPDPWIHIREGGETR